MSSKAIRALVMHHWLILNALLLGIALLTFQVNLGCGGLLGGRTLGFGEGEEYGWAQFIMEPFLQKDKRNTDINSTMMLI